MKSVITRSSTEAVTETIHKKKKAVVPDPSKIIYAENVTMKPEEHAKLITDNGEAITAACIAKLSNYKGAHNKKYASDYRAILSWVLDEVKAKLPLAIVPRKREVVL